MLTIRKLIKVLCLGMVFSPCYAEDFTIVQKGKTFSASSLNVSKGDTVHFLNSDPFFHNVFSLSDTKFFDLGSYPEGESKSVTFDSEGVIEVECAIHPEMKMTITVGE